MHCFSFLRIDFELAPKFENCINKSFRLCLLCLYNISNHIDILLHIPFEWNLSTYVYFLALYLYVPDEGSLLPKYIDCTTSNGFESYIYLCTEWAKSRFTDNT